jgi:hypothetical protein
MARRHSPQQKQRSFPIWLFAGALLLIFAAVGLWFVQNAETGSGNLGPRLSVNTSGLILASNLSTKWCARNSKSLTQAIAH